MTSSDALKLTEQLELLCRCVKEDMELGPELRCRGLSYESLRYRENKAITGNGGKYRQIDEVASTKKSDLAVVSFFSGCGGIDLGFEAAGFEHLACFEIVRFFCDTLRRNRPGWKVFGPPVSTGDLRNREETEAILRGTIGSKRKFDGIFCGGPPCQSFSVAANQRFSKSGSNFKRVGFDHAEYGNLLFDYIHYIQVFRPLAFVLENVPGLMSVDSGKQLRSACDELVKSGYQLTGPIIVDAARYGVPQHRLRLFVMGSRDKRRIIAPLEEEYLVPCWKALEKPIIGLANTETREHKASSVTRYMELKYGERDDLGRVDRLDPNTASKTVIAGGDKGGGRSHLHPFVPRTMSARETARLQTFPDDFVFEGTSGRQFTQVGNAVPPLLAYKIACAIRKSLLA